MIARASFSRLVREVAQDFKLGLRLSPKASLLLQYVTEAHVVTLLTGANVSAIHAERTSIQPKDIQLVRHLVGDVKVAPTCSNVPVISFDGGIKKVLAQVHPAAALKSDSKSQLNFFLNKLASALISSASGLANLNDRTTLSARHVQAAVKEILPGELAKRAVSEGTKASTKYQAFAFVKDKKVKTNGAEKSGLQFSVSKVKTLLRGCSKLQKVKVYNGNGKTHLVKGGCNRRVGALAPVYLAAVLEYIAAEILELSGNSARDHKHERITARDLLLDIDSDPELMTLKKKLNVEILGGGVVPNIASVLLPVKKVKKSKKEDL